MPASPAFDLFLSYAWGAFPSYPGKQHAALVARVLRSWGYTVWLDDDHLAETSSDADAAMFIGISRSSAVVMLVSGDFAVSPNCKKEACFARDAGKPRFFINGGALDYTPKSFDHASEEAILRHGWLRGIVGEDIWSDSRAIAASITGGGGPIELSAVEASLSVLGRQLAACERVRKSLGRSLGAGDAGAASCADPATETPFVHGSLPPAERDGPFGGMPIAQPMRQSLGGSAIGPAFGGFGSAASTATATAAAATLSPVVATTTAGSLAGGFGFLPTTSATSGAAASGLLSSVPLASASPSLASLVSSFPFCSTPIASSPLAFNALASFHLFAGSTPGASGPSTAPVGPLSPQMPSTVKSALPALSSPTAAILSGPPACHGSVSSPVSSAPAVANPSPVFEITIMPSDGPLGLKLSFHLEGGVMTGSGAPPPIKVEVSPGKPAAAAGVRSGMILVAVNGESMEGRSPPQALETFKELRAARTAIVLRLSEAAGASTPAASIAAPAAAASAAPRPVEGPSAFSFGATSTAFPTSAFPFGGGSAAPASAGSGPGGVSSSFVAAAASSLAGASGGSGAAPPSDSSTTTKHSASISAHASPGALPSASTVTWANVSLKEKNMPLLDAILDKDPRRALKIIESGVEQRIGAEALTRACMGGLETVAERLIEIGCDVHGNASDFTPLMAASCKGLTGIAARILEKGASVNATNKHGDTALVYACKNGHAQTAMALLSDGATASITGYQGRTPLLLCADHSDTMAAVAVALRAAGGK